MYGLNRLRKIDCTKGHGFSRAIQEPNGMRALAAEVRFFILPRAQSIGSRNEEPYLSG
jgi:hypothetical protein